MAGVALAAMAAAGARRRTAGRPVFAWWYGRLVHRAERGELGSRRHALLGRASGRVLDLGAGTGESFKHIPPPVGAVAGVEPDPAMVRQARRRTAETAVPVLLVRAAGEALPFREAAFDTAVATLVLCTVQDPLATARELHRVVRPAGRLLFMEHVRAGDDVLASWQDRVQRLWSWVNGGCHPNRPTLDVLERAGFGLGELETYGFAVLPHVQGVAVRDAGASAPPPAGVTER